MIIIWQIHVLFSFQDSECDECQWNTFDGELANHYTPSTLSIAKEGRHGKLIMTRVTTTALEKLYVAKITFGGCIKRYSIILQTVFHHVGKALAILITLDHIFTVGDTFREHWNQYKR